MDFTREPIIETIITPKEGCKLVIRSTKNTGQEEYLVDAVEVVSFGQAFFFRSLERPKAFLTPVSDFEVLEVKEARMVLKNVSQDRSIKIGGGRDGQIKGSAKETEKSSQVIQEESKSESDNHAKENEKSESDVPAEIRLDKKRDRRRNYRKKRGNENLETQVTEEKAQEVLSPSEEDQPNAPAENESEQNSSIERTSALPLSVLSSLLQPPPTLISETINQYRQNDMFKTAFFLSEEDQYKPHDKVDDLLNEEDQFDPVNEAINNEAINNDNHDHSVIEEQIEDTFHSSSDNLLDTDETMLRFDTEAALPLFEEEEKVHGSSFNYSLNEEKNDISNEADLIKEVSNEVSDIDRLELQQEETQEVDKEILVNEHHEDLPLHLKEQSHHSEEEKTHFSPEN